MMEKLFVFEMEGVIHAALDEPLASPDQFLILPNVQESFFELGRNKINAVVAANDEWVGPGGMTTLQWEEIAARLHQHIEEVGGKLHDIVLRTKSENDQDDWRYPKPNLLQSIASQHGVSAGQTHFVCASLPGLQAGWAAGCRTLFVKTGRPFQAMQYLKTASEGPDSLTPDLLSAVIKGISL